MTKRQKPPAPAGTVAAPVAALPSERLVALLRPLLPVGSELVLDHAEVSRHTTVKVRLGDRTLAAVRVADADLAAVSDFADAPVQLSSRETKTVADLLTRLLAGVREEALSEG